MSYEDVNLTDKEVEEIMARHELSYVSPIDEITEEDWNRYGEIQQRTIRLQARDMSYNLPKKSFMRSIIKDKATELEYSLRLLRVKIMALQAQILKPFWNSIYMKIEKEYNRFLFYSKKHTDKDKITPEQIDRAKEYPITELLPGIRKAGSVYLTVCPFHQEKSPSFTIFKDNHFHCFGCHISGDAIDLYMKLQDISFPDAVKALSY